MATLNKYGRMMIDCPVKSVSISFNTDKSISKT